MLIYCSYRTKKQPLIVKREPMPDLLDGIKSEKINEVVEMPACAEFEMSRIPSPLPLQKKSSKSNINLNYVSWF